MPNSVEREGRMITVAFPGFPQGSCDKSDTENAAQFNVYNMFAKI